MGQVLCVAGWNHSPGGLMHVGPLLTVAWSALCSHKSQCRPGAADGSGRHAVVSGSLTHTHTHTYSHTHTHTHTHIHTHIHIHTPASQPGSPRLREEINHLGEATPSPPPLRPAGLSLSPLSPSVFLSPSLPLFLALTLSLL